MISGLQEFASHVQDGLEEADWALRRQIIRTLVKQVEVGHEKVNIVYRITPSPNMAPSDGESLQDCKKRVVVLALESLPESGG